MKLVTAIATTEAEEHIAADHAILQRIWNLHQPSTLEVETISPTGDRTRELKAKWCEECSVRWPCRTIACFNENGP